MCDKIEAIMKIVRNTRFVSVDFEEWDAWFQRILPDFTEWRVQVLATDARAAAVTAAAEEEERRVAAADEERVVAASSTNKMPTGTSQGSSAGVSPAGGPGTGETPGVSSGASLDQGADAAEDRAFAAEQAEARARIFGVAPEIQTAPTMPKKTRHEMAMDKKINEMAASLGELELGTASSEPKASMELHSSFPMTPDEAWVIRTGGKFEIYARRVVQFAIICSTGCRFDEKVAYLRRAPLPKVLEKYKSIIMNLGWHTMFLPGFFMKSVKGRSRFSANIAN